MRSTRYLPTTRVVPLYVAISCSKPWHKRIFTAIGARLERLVFQNKKTEVHRFKNTSVLINQVTNDMICFYMVSKHSLQMIASESW